MLRNIDFTSRALRLLLGGLSILSVMWGGTQCASAEQNDPSTSSHRPGMVVVIRGLAGYWPSCGSFCQRVRNYGEHVVTYNMGLEARMNSDQIVSEMRSGRWSHLRIVGYSNGADAAIEVARDLQGRGVFVERLILIEPTNPRNIPGNVGYCYNIYESRPRTDWMPAFRGMNVQRESGRTVLYNYDVARTRGRMTQLNHFDFSADSQVQSIAAWQAGAPAGSRSANNAIASNPQTADAKTPGNQSRTTTANADDADAIRQ